MKGKGEKERYTHLNAEFQRIPRRDKKVLLRDQYKEIEENNRMGKIRDLLKKIRDTKGTFHAKLPILGKETDLQFQEAPRTPSSINPQRATYIHICIYTAM